VQNPTLDASSYITAASAAVDALIFAQTNNLPGVNNMDLASVEAIVAAMLISLPLQLL